MDNLTNLDAVNTDVKDPHHAGDEGPDGLEVQTADTPRAIHQQDDISLGMGLAAHIYVARVHTISLESLGGRKMKM